MRITRAAKVAAFPLIVLALVALVACQGPMGLPGKDGKDGTTGDQGERGGRGFPALAPVADADVVQIDEDTKGEVTVPLSEYFAGGVGDRTYAVVRTTVAEGQTLAETGITEPKTADISGSVLTLAVTADPTDFDGVTVVVKATDTAMVSVNNNVVIRRNQAPMVATGIEIMDLTIGLQTDEHAATIAETVVDTNFMCSAFNVCSLTVTELGRQFTDDTTEDNDLDKLKYTATSSAPGIVHVETASDGSIKITGLTKLAADEPVEITVTATDSNELTAEKKFEVTVDQPPKLSKALPTLRRRIENMPQTYKVFDITDYFNDPESETEGVSYVSGKSSDPLLATLSETNGANTDAVSVVVPINAHGTATITLKVKEPDRDGNNVGIGQWVEASFMVVIS